MVEILRTFITFLEYYFPMEDEFSALWKEIKDAVEKLKKM
jgi:hypothetical protein